MEKIGIICEYNPFHNGHLYHIEKIKKMYPDSIIILVMSGYFTERGEISLLSKYNKTKVALEYGIDIVLELPCLFAVNSADYFAEAALKALSLAKVNKIVFGSESNDIDLLKNTAKEQIDNENFEREVKKLLDKGLNYPTALAKTLKYNFKSNDLLAISYIKSIIKNNYSIEPITIKRTNDYNDTDSNDEIVSASNIREKYKQNLPIEKFIPNYKKDYLNKIDYDRLFILLKYKIITSNELNTYLGVDEGLDNKLKIEIKKAFTINELLNNIKSKRYTYVRLERMLIHVLLGIKKNDMKFSLEYIRILGFNKKGQKYLKEINTNKLIYRDNSRIREIELRACEIYYILTGDDSSKYEYLNKPIKIDI